MSERYAVYYAPAQDSELHRFGSHWLGRCAESGQSCPRPAVPDLRGLDLDALTSEPRRYGFHATLVPPFRLKNGWGFVDLLEHATRFARLRRSFSLDSLRVRKVGSFIALVPEEQHGVAELAASCVRFFHPFREEPTLAEMERRRSMGLTPVQERLMARWGYPYVFDEYRFHMTLTNSIVDKGLRRKVGNALSELAAPLRKTAYPVRELCLFHQPDAAIPFRLIRRIPFGG